MKMNHTCQAVTVGSALLKFLAVWLFFFPLLASAQYAVSGAGLHKSRIVWINWGADASTITSPSTVSQTVNIGGDSVSVGCTLSSLSFTQPPADLNTYSLRSYTSGGYQATGNGWRGDGFDNLYNGGGYNNGGTLVNGGNTLTVSIKTNPSGSTGVTTTFDVSCSVSKGTQTLPLRSVVFAEAEASSLTTSPSEFVGIRVPSSSSASFHVIDGINFCNTTGTFVIDTSLAGFNEYRLVNPSGSCQSVTPAANRTGPSLVAALQNATGGTVVMKSGGTSAISFGVMLEYDYSENIPSTYGIASHLLQQMWSGGNTPSLNYASSPTGAINVATAAALTPYLGTTVSADTTVQAIATADVDGLATTGGFANLPTISTYGVPLSLSVTCVGPGSVAGWIDFNGNGQFDDSERSNTSVCPTGSNAVSLSWTVPALGSYTAQATSYMRLRVSQTDHASDLASATGLARSGEVEDYRVVLPSLPTSDMSVTLSLPTSAVVGSTTLGSVSFSNISASVTSTQVIYALQLSPGLTSVAVSGPVLGAGFYNSVTGIVTFPSAPTNVTANTSVTASISFLQPNASVLATATTGAANDSNSSNNTSTAILIPRAASLSVVKDNGTNTLVAGSSTSYTVTFSNGGPYHADGAVAKDTPSAGLSCSVSSCTASNGAACPSSAPALLSSAGATILTFPSASSLTFVVACGVLATGL